MKQTVLVLILILALAVVGYVWYAYFQSAPETVTEPAITHGSKTLLDRVGALRRLKNLRLDTSVFQDPLFQTLETAPASQELVSGGEGERGRINPFTPF